MKRERERGGVSLLCLCVVERVVKSQRESIPSLVFLHRRMRLMKDLSEAAAFTKYIQRLISVLSFAVTV